MSTSPADAVRDNEDFASFEPNTIVLLDGAGTPPGSESGCVHGVAWFTRHLGIQFLARAAQDQQMSLPRCLRDAIGSVRSMHGNDCDLSHPGTPSATVLAVRMGVDPIEYLVLADSVLVLDCLDAPVVVTDDREARVGREHRRAMDALPSGTPEHTRALQEYVETLHRYRNIEGGFWVAAADPAAADQAVTGSVPRNELRSVALLSDGASRLADRFHLADWSGVLRILREQGPDRLIFEVRAAEDSDPRGERWPRGKNHDDATVVYAVF